MLVWLVILRKMLLRLCGGGWMNNFNFPNHEGEGCGLLILHVVLPKFSTNYVLGQ